MMVAPSSARTRAKILIVDDSRVARESLRAPLEEAGYRVIEAVDGEDGLAKIALHEDAALVLCDVNMPVRDGLSLLQALTADGAKPPMPIVMITTEQEVELVQRAKRAGARGWIVKPFQIPLVLSAVRKLAGWP